MFSYTRAVTPCFYGTSPLLFYLAVGLGIYDYARAARGCRVLGVTLLFKIL